MKHWEEIIRWKINRLQKIDKNNLTKIKFYKRKSQLELFFNNATTFFRWNFDELEKYLSNNYWYKKILSLPCSIWPEAYSIWAIMEDLQIPYDIDGVDYSEKCIKKAKEGFYNIEIDKVGIDKPYLKKYKKLIKLKQKNIIIDDKLKKKINFFKGDIFTKENLNWRKYDIIIFQNLIIHFQDEPKKIEIMVKNLLSLLKNNWIIFTDDVEINSIIRVLENLWIKYKKIWKSIIKI